MPTKKSAKAATTKKAAPKKPTTTTTVRTVSVSSTSSSALAGFDGKMVNIALAELIGTFVLTMVALLAAADIVPLFVGLTLAVLVMAIGAVSGSHVNPIVSLGLWSVGKLKAKLLPLYWVAQFVGAMAAVVVMTGVAGTKTGLDFSHFSTFSWPIFWLEFVGTAVFLFGLVSVVSRPNMSDGAKAVGIGLSLMVGILVTNSMYKPVYDQALTDYRAEVTAATSEEGAETPAIPHEIYVTGATLNPAVALAATEQTESALRGTATSGEAEKKYSRLSLEVLLATAAGALVGAQAARALNYRFKK